MFRFLLGIAIFFISVSAQAQLYVANADGETVGEYNATTGAAINANFITGLNNDWELALSGNSLYVASYNGISTVGEYNATTGAAINANLITGLPYSTELAIAPAPEPPTFVLLAAGALGLVGYCWRRRRALRRTAKPTDFVQQDAPAIMRFPSHSSQMSAARRAA